ncbi:MAG: hypothetical protein ACPHN3_05360, partial [Spongiibacter sp.]
MVVGFDDFCPPRAPHRSPSLLGYDYRRIRRAPQNHITIDLQATGFTNTGPTDSTGFYNYQKNRIKA